MTAAAGDRSTTAPPGDADLAREPAGQGAPPSGPARERLVWAARLALAWALASLAWALGLLDPEEGHTQGVVRAIPWLAALAVGSTVALGSARGDANGPSRATRAWAVAGIVAALAALLTPVPFLPTLALAALALPHLASFLPWPLRSGVAALAGPILTIPLLAQVPDLADIPDDRLARLVTPALTGCLSLLGHPDVASSGPLLHFAGKTVLIDPIKTAWPFAATLLAANLVTLLLLVRTRAPGLRMVCAAGSACLASLLSGLHHAIELQPGTYAMPDIALSCAWTVPLAAGLAGQLAALAGLWRLPAGDERLVQPPAGAVRPAGFHGFRMATAAGLVGLAAVVSGGAFVPGLRPIEVLADEIHGRWEPFFGSYGRDADETRGLNNYRSFLNWLCRRVDVRLVVPEGSRVQVPEAGVSVEPRASLGGWLLDRPARSQVLVVKCVTTPLTQPEIEAVEAFVRAGGSLVLIGDHTDVMSMNTNLNPLAARFGIRFRCDSTYMLDGSWVVTSPKDLARHPAVRRVDTFSWANGCTLELEGAARPVVHSPWASFREPARYEVENFFGDKLLDPTDRFGRSVIAAVSTVGRGRVFAFTDSTCFNNELFFTVGRRELLSSLLGWFSLEHEPAPAALAVVLAVLAWLSYSGRRLLAPGVVSGLLPVAAVAWVAGSVLACAIVAHASLELRPTRPDPPAIVIDGSHEPGQSLVLDGRTRWEPSCDSLLGLAGDLGRLPYFPEVALAPRFDPAARGKVVLLVVASPRRPYSPDEQRSIDRFVREGGALLLIEGAGGNGAVNSLARLFGMEFAPGHVDLGRTHGVLVNPTPVLGGLPLVETSGHAVAACATHGQGLVACLGDDLLLAAGNGRRGELHLERLVHDVAAALCSRDAFRLRRLPLARTLVAGQPYD